MSLQKKLVVTKKIEPQLGFQPTLIRKACFWSDLREVSQQEVHKSQVPVWWVCKKKLGPCCDKKCCNNNKHWFGLSENGKNFGCANSLQKTCDKKILQWQKPQSYRIGSSENMRGGYWLWKWMVLQKDSSEVCSIPFLAIFLANSPSSCPVSWDHTTVSC